MMLDNLILFCSINKKQMFYLHYTSLAAIEPQVVRNLFFGSLPQLIQKCLKAGIQKMLSLV
jgi:hypothetical protein